MRKRFYLPSLISFSFFLNAQQVTFEEYDLDNGLHVILHQDNTAPVVVTSVLYHVGAKNEEDDRTGFAHFFEHLLFEGTENIERGDWFKIVSSNGGRNNAYTTDDFTYYYEVFPSNNIELGLWMESERMLHPIINEIGVETQNEVVKEEKRLRYDNSPYGKWAFEVRKRMFEKHPYRHIPIGEMDHLDAASLEEFIAFNKKFYIPNNAVLVVAGDFEMKEAKKMVTDYFNEIPKGEEIEIQTFEETPITEPITAEAFEIKITEGILNYYDIENYLKIQVSQTMEIMGNSQTNVIKMNDYKNVDGIFFPHKAVMSMGPQEIELITQNIELNAEIDSEIFK